MKKFKEYSKFPPCYKDFSFWVPTSGEEGEGWHENDFCERVRDVAGDLVERVELVSFIFFSATRSPENRFWTEVLVLLADR